MTKETVNHPTHYNMGGPIGHDGSAQYEAIKLIEDLGWGYGFCMGNALKYALRAPHKGSELEDWRKCAWYLERAMLPKNEALIRPPSLREVKFFDAVRAWAPTAVDANDAITAIGQGDAAEALQYVNFMELARSANATR